ncbi:MAG: S8 family peptidase [Eggerthellaceae bacterium]|nr:S8 family peptidase [Eggerthellaceae bacterium]
MSNDSLELRGTFHRKGATAPGPPTLPAGASVTSEMLEIIRDKVLRAIEDWGTPKVSVDPIVSVRYIRVAAKSNRIRKLLTKGSEDASDHIVGAKFDPKSDPKSPKHIITYCVPKSALNKTVEILGFCIEILDAHFENRRIGKEQLDIITREGFVKYKAPIPKTTFAQVVRDVYFIEDVFIEDTAPEIMEESFVTLYKTGIETKSLLKQLGIEVADDLIIGETVRLYPNDYLHLKQNAPFLISMSTEDLSQYGPPIKGDEDPEESDPEVQGTNDVESYVFPSIPQANSEPWVGVIDTVFGRNAYFYNYGWVEDEDYTAPDTPEGQSICHGTQVTSIIVDGPSLNPGLQDGCGRFRVKHFGVSKGGKISTFTLMRRIRDIVMANSSIKVWNISLGTPNECPEHAISPVAAMLDELQREYDVLFIVAGTNGSNEKVMKRIGAPADSINSIVVSAVDRDGAPTEYSRKGPVLHFFHKPDIAYYGGTKDDPLFAAAPYAITRVKGTSYAAPWITRKAAYLIYKANRTKEETKALLIDAAFGWGEKPPSLVKGYGVPPINIRDIIETSNDEIRFIISGTIDAYETYNYKIPVPLHDGKYPFKARATLCYFPECQRSQGVDYTSTEIDLHFGRLKGNGLKSLDKNIQGDEGAQLYESDARKLFRKWDNVKHIADKFKGRFAPRKVYDSQYWGLMLRKKERSNSNNQAGNGMPFSVVVTLKEMFGKNRLEEFIYRCSLEEGWLVKRINVETINEIYAAANVDIEFDE